MPLVRSCLVLVLLAAALPAGAVEADPAAAPVDLQRGLRIPMRDGVTLNATLYRPRAAVAAGTRLPVLFSLTPYLSDTQHYSAMYFARHGYTVVAVDARGRGGSGGVFRSWSHEAHDGYDTVEWLARQPWSNGKVGAYGGSYLGFAQWATFKEAPPHLRTMVPTASVRPGLDFPQLGGIFMSFNARWLTFVSGVAITNYLFVDENLWRDRYGDVYLGHLPFRSLDRVVGSPSRIFQEYVQHPDYDGYWQAMAPSAADYARVDIPILTITGHWDDDQTGALSYYREHQRYASASARARHYLVIGPWDHAGTRVPAREMGGFKFGDASLVDMNQLHLAWFDWVLKDGKRPDFLKQRVAYYVTGEEAWKYADRLEDIPATPRRYYLASDGNANDVFHSGTLAAAQPASAPPDHYVYDPLDLRPGRGELGRDGHTDNTWLVDQTRTLDLYGAGVVYHSAPLAEPTELSGVPRASLWLAMDVPDSDLHAVLTEVRPDGSALMLSDMYLRARYRDSLSHARPVPSGQIVRYDLDHFSFVSRRLDRGSRLRLTVSAVNSIWWEKNHNSGGVVADETARVARTAHVTVYHDAAHPSAIELPLVATAQPLAHAAAP